MKTKEIVEHFLNTFAEEVCPNMNAGDVDILRKKALRMCEAIELATLKKVINFVLDMDNSKFEGGIRLNEKKFIDWLEARVKELEK